MVSLFLTFFLETEFLFLAQLPPKYESISRLFEVPLFFLLYVSAAIFLMKRQGLEPTRSDFVTKRMIGLTSWAIFSIVTALQFPGGSINESESTRTEWILMTAVPMLAVMVFYLIGMRYVERHHRREQLRSSRLGKGEGVSFRKKTIRS